MKDFVYGTKIVCGFPGTGKSYFIDSEAYRGSFSSSDSDSSTFDKTDFPANYIAHIKSLIGKKRIVFVSSHKIVREALSENKIPYTLVYPQIGLKEEYLGRYRKRGSPESFVKLVSDNWETWITDCINQQGCQHIVLKSGQSMDTIF